MHDAPGGREREPELRVSHRFRADPLESLNHTTVKGQAVGVGCITSTHFNALFCIAGLTSPGGPRRNWIESFREIAAKNRV